SSMADGIAAQLIFEQGAAFLVIYRPRKRPNKSKTRNDTSSPWKQQASLNRTRLPSFRISQLASSNGLQRSEPRSRVRSPSIGLVWDCCRNSMLLKTPDWMRSPANSSESTLSGGKAVRGQK